MTTSAQARCAQAGGSHIIGSATTDDTDEAAAVLAEAFAGYPFTDWIVPEDNRPHRLRGLFAITVGRVGLPHGEVWVARCPGTLDIVGVSVGLGSHAVPNHVWSSIEEEEHRLLGDRAEAAAWADRATGHLRPTVPHYTVATMGVLPSHRRRGLATLLLEPLLDAAEGAGLLSYLETSTVQNLGLYKSSGFTVDSEATVPGGGPHVWSMTTARADAKVAGKPPS